MNRAAGQHKLYKFLKFVGRKGLFWFGVSLLSATLMAGVEIALSVTLALLIKSLGISKEAPPLPLGLNNLELSTRLVVFVLIGIGALRSLFMFLMAQSTMYSNSVIELRLKMILLYKYFKTPRFEGSLAEFNYYVADIFTKANTFCGALLLLLPAMIQSMILLVILFTRTFETTLVGLVGIAFAGLLLSTLPKKVVSYSTIIRDHSMAWQQKIVRAIRNWNMLRALRLTEHEYASIGTNHFTQLSLSIRTAFFANLGSALPQMMGIVVATGLIAMQLRHPQLSGIEFIGYLYLFLRFVLVLAGGATNFGALAGNYPQFMTAARYFFSFTPEQIADAVSGVSNLNFMGSNWETVGTNSFPGQKYVVTPRPVRSDLPAIRLSGVSFAYDGSHRILSGLNHEVPAGTSLAIVGPSGSGKSTLLSLILGVLAPQSGEVSVGGLPAEEYFKKNLHCVGYVGADPYLIDGSIKDNLMYGNPFEVTPAMLDEALELAQLGGLLKGLPSGIAHRLTENGEGLSTGQKQRLSLARAFLRNPSLLVLDEISANLDMATETEIASTLKQMNYKATILIVSHRAGLVEHVTNRLDLGR